MPWTIIDHHESWLIIICLWLSETRKFTDNGNVMSCFCFHNVMLNKPYGSLWIPIFRIMSWDFLRQLSAQLAWHRSWARHAARGWSAAPCVKAWSSLGDPVAAVEPKGRGMGIEILILGRMFGLIDFYLDLIFGFHVNGIYYDILMG